jgi:phytoene synthase
MFAIYAFCRAVDDIADSDEPPARKLVDLARWRDEIDRLYAGRPVLPAAVALADPVRRFALPREEFIAMIEGMEMDARDQMRAPPMDDLTGYCRRVAGAVGMLSIRVFGDDSAAAQRFALALGEAFQLTNILRDIDEDAAMGRLYLPRELLLRHSVPLAADPAQVPAQSLAETLAHPAIPAVCADLAGLARRRFAEADAALAACNRPRLRPALLMMGIYERILDRLEPTGWRPGARRVRLSKTEKLWAAIHQGVFRPRCQPST